MDLLTFGKVILFENNHYVWLVNDIEEEKLHLAIILDKEKTRDLIGVDNALAKKHTSSADAPMFAYVVLTTEDFEGRAAHLMNSDGRAESKDDFSILGDLNNDDIAKLKAKILGGLGVSSRLVNLVKNLG